MVDRTARRLAWPIAALSGVLLAAGIALGAMAMARAGDPVGLLSHQLTIPLSGVVLAPLGALLLARHPRHPIAWMLTGLGVLTGIEMLNLGFLAYRSLIAPGEVIAAPGLSHWLAQWIWAPRAFVPITLLLLLFPDGKLASRRWRPVAWATGAGLAVSTTVSALAPNSWEGGMGGVVWNPLGLESPLWTPLRLFSGVLLAACFLACLASVIVRFRKSVGIERQQLMWMTYAVGLVLFLCLVTGALFALSSNARLATEVLYSSVNLVAACIAVAVTIAVLRYRLYDIDLIINRTLVYGVLTGLVVGLYVLVVGSLGSIFQARGSLLVSLVATGLIAVLFQPMRDRLQKSVNRTLYGRRDEPYDVLSRVGRHLEDAAAPETMLATIVDTIARNLKLPYVAIALQEGSDSRIACQSGQRPRQPISIPLHHRGQLVGELICAPRSDSEAFSERERRLLHDIANQAAVAIHAERLSTALQRSREQLVSTREEERRRLRRDLHDGLGPQLASLAVKLDAARNHLEANPEVADALLVELSGQVRDAIADIRRLVYNLRPPALDELGLLPALRASAEAQALSGAPRVEVDGPSDLPDLPAAVEVAAYRITQEAVTNVARHAHAQHCHVRLDLHDGLQLEIRDDGVGLPDGFQPGVGLSSMRERTDELGGQLRVEGVEGGGTRVVAHFPLGRGQP